MVYIYLIKYNRSSIEISGVIGVSGMVDIYKQDAKSNIIIVSYYLSRCNWNALETLGYKTFAVAFESIGKLMNIKPATVKNIRDQFDPYFDNGRAGWYQRELQGSRKTVFDEFADYTDERLGDVVKKILDLYKPEESREKILRNLNQLIRLSTIHYKNDFELTEVYLTNDFKNKYTKCMEDKECKIEFFDSTAIITTSTYKNVFLPNQWFAIAAYAVGVYRELMQYKYYLEKNISYIGEKKETYIKNLREGGTPYEKDRFLSGAVDILNLECQGNPNVEQAAKYLWRFVSDYSWWSGQKTIDRGDFYISVVLNMLNLLNASQGYVADIVNVYGEDIELYKMVSSLDSFTTNLEGITYLTDVSSESDMSEIPDPVKLDSEPIKTETKTTQKTKIKISSESINKVKGKNS